MLIAGWAAASVLLVAWGGNAIAADLDSYQDPACHVSDEEQQKLGCLCVGPRVVDTTHVGLLSEIKGDVLVSQQAGYSPVKDPTPLDIGDGIQVKSDSSALLTVGMKCSREVGPNASLIVRQTENGCACAALLQEKPKLGLLHAGLIVGGGILIVDKLNPVSP